METKKLASVASRSKYAGAIFSLGLVTGLLSGISAASAVEINVGNYGFAPTAMPFAVAKEEGFFKAAGVDVTGIRNAPGGNAARLMVSGNLAYADGGLTEVVGGNQAGAHFKIVSDNSHNAGGVDWVTLPNSPIKTPQDIKGKRLTFTAPQSITEAWAHWIVNKLGFKQGDVNLIAAGGIGQGLTLLQHGGADVAVIDLTTLAKNPGKYRVVIAGNDAKIFPPLNDTVGYVDATYAASHPDIIRGIIAAHRRAVKFMMTNRKQAAADIAKVFKADPRLIEGLLNQFIDHDTVDGVPFYGEGNIYRGAMETTLKMARLVGAIKGKVNLDAMIDESYLPPDLRSHGK